ncbi:hypothetical protein [Ferrimonas sp. YFM]|uniref:hypothetical protein n=1 Tax=Ferrimonas sp. YFM TaxID=3028878 RepID=UPI0025734299|nr:hypothetical protein [Ferrimonas sp. YFM]BDY04497.1 hypothetical protein F0521_15380 [Ferrimonas sp. YFM]
MKRLVLLIVLTLLSQTASAVLEGSHVHIGADLQSIEIHFDSGNHHHDGHHDETQEHQHSDGETCLHHHCHAGHLAIAVTETAPATGRLTQHYVYLRGYPDPQPSELLRPPIA